MAVAVSCFPARLQDINEGQTSIRMLLGELHEMLCSWREQAAKLEAGEISKEDYGKWRYHYPDLDTSSIRQKVGPSQDSKNLFARDTDE